MKEPPRLRDQSQNPLISQMLSAARRQEPQKRAVHSTLLAAATAATVVGGQATAGAAIAGTSAASLAKLAAKWTLLSAVVVGGGVAGVESSGLLSDRSVATLAASSASASGASRSLPVSRSAAQAPGREEGVAVLPEAVLPEPNSALPASARLPQKARQPTQTRPEQLEREVAVLDQARSALNQGRYGDVRRLSERYLSEYPQGRLEQEARYLQMQAARRQGDSARAQAEARALLELNPNGPHAKAAREVQLAGE